jgi:hypothetical protein
MIIRTLPTKNGYAQKARSVPSGLKFATLEAYYLRMHCNVLSCNTTTA